MLSESKAHQVLNTLRSFSIVGIDMFSDLSNIGLNDFGIEHLETAISREKNLQKYLLKSDIPVLLKEQILNYFNELKRMKNHSNVRESRSERIFPDKVLFNMLERKYTVEQELGILNFYMSNENASVYFPPTCLESIFSNLVNNSLESILDMENGKIVITSNIDMQMYSFLFRDNGRGMSEQTKEKVFYSEDMYTTKSNGNGFGINECIRELRKYGGRLQPVYSELGKGTAIRVDIPIANENDKK